MNHANQAVTRCPKCNGIHATASCPYRIQTVEPGITDIIYHELGCDNFHERWSYQALTLENGSRGFRLISSVDKNEVYSGIGDTLSQAFVRMFANYKCGIREVSDISAGLNPFPNLHTLTVSEQPPSES